MKKLVLVAMLTACGGGVVATTVPAPVTTATLATTTTAAPAFVVEEPTLFPIDSLPGSGGAAGSGCEPGDGPLPDGIWFGAATARGSDSIEFDLACFFSGEAANEAAAEDGSEEIPVPNDYYIRNNNPDLRSVPVASEAVVYSLGESIEEMETVAWSEWPVAPSYLPCPGEFCLVWLYVNNGSATEIVEQYTP